MGIEEKEPIEQEIDLQALANAEDQQQEQQEDEQHELSPIEQKAFDQGWRPEEDFKGPEENWKTAKEYVRDGEFLATIKEQNQRIDQQKREFDERLENTNKLHEARRQAEITSLKAAQRTAVREADEEAFDTAQGQIDKLEKETPQQSAQQPAKATSIVEWEAKNSWINDNNDERTPVTHAIWNRYLQQNPNATPEQALAHVDGRISQLYPTNNTNPRREQPNTTETPRKASRQKGKSLTMNDLTSDERQDWKMFGSQMFSESEFLKTVADTRKK